MLSTRVLKNGLWSYDLLRTVSKRIITNALIDPGAACRLRLNRLSEPPLPADHSNFVHQQNDYGR